MAEGERDLAPACRVCGQPLELIDAQRQGWYCYEDDQIWLDKEQRWMEETTEQLEQQERTKYCKKCGNRLDLQDEYCDRCGAKQMRVVRFDQKTLQP
jgi:ribosomal protein L40E